MGRNEWADRFVDCVIRRTEWDALPKTNGIVLILVLPTIIIFCLLSETFVKSLTAGAVKG